jgi:hypothetical protein
MAASWHNRGMVKPPPISLRLSARESTVRARRLLATLRAEDRVQSKVRLQATRAWLAVLALGEAAAPKMKQSENDRWRKNYDFIEKTLQEISRRGI